MCRRPWEELLILADGRCFFCCYMREPIGHIDADQPEEIWYGPRAQAVRDALERGEVPAACQDGLVGPCPELGRR